MLERLELKYIPLIVYFVLSTEQNHSLSIVVCVVFQACVIDKTTKIIGQEYMKVTVNYGDHGEVEMDPEMVIFFGHFMQSTHFLNVLIQ